MSEYDLQTMELDKENGNFVDESDYLWLTIIEQSVINGQSTQAREQAEDSIRGLKDSALRKRLDQLHVLSIREINSDSPNHDLLVANNLIQREVMTRMFKRG